MALMPKAQVVVFAIMALAGLIGTRSQAQAALLLEEPYGFFGTLNPTGHNAFYFERICTETPVKLRRCEAGELGSVIARYQGISGYDWVAMPLIPYLYSVEDAAEVPTHVDKELVKKMRDRYHEAHLDGLGEDVSSGNFVHGGWTQLLGAAYERRIYAFRFETTPEQDDALIARLNEGPNRSRFDLLFNNCSDFSRGILSGYLPQKFGRSIFPDAFITTPKQITGKVVKYAREHPDTELTVFEIPQVPGYRRASHSNKSIAESLTTTGYAVPLVLMNPYLAGGLFVDYVVRGRFDLIPKNPQVISPETLSALTAAPVAGQNPGSAGAQVPSAAGGGSAETQTSQTAKSGLREITGIHE